MNEGYRRELFFELTPTTQKDTVAIGQV